MATSDMRGGETGTRLYRCIRDNRVHVAARYRMGCGARVARDAAPDRRTRGDGELSAVQSGYGENSSRPWHPGITVYAYINDLDSSCSPKGRRKRYTRATRVSLSLLCARGNQNAMYNSFNARPRDSETNRNN